ncbi:VOC family protein [Paraburkholderia sp.]|uniref:VOC family protein n=1 Tax=Paraburkholderia sp. TaxID=1926495 RepID=UPI0039E5D02B
MNITHLDHLVLTVRDFSRTIEFYEGVLGMKHAVFDSDFHALHFGNQKINLHPYRNEYSPHAEHTLPGTGDLCFISEGSMESIVSELGRRGVKIEVGPVPQTGARGPMQSVYFRDPDGNLIEIAIYD